MERWQRDIDALTGLRGIAAYWVALYHARATIFPGLDLPRPLANALGEGWIAVDLFFVLSGFIMCYVHQADFRTIAIQSAGRFLKLRLARIYPAHLVVALCWLPVLALAMWQAPQSLSEGVASHFNLRTFLFAVSLTNGWGFPHSQGWNLASWSVGSEWFAYLCFPFIAWWMNRLRGAGRYLAAAASVCASCVILALVINTTRQYMLPESFSLVRVVSEFIVGCCAYGVFRGLGGGRGYAWLAPSAALAATSLALMTHPRIIDVLYMPLFAALIVGLTDPRSLPSRFLAMPALTYLGRISYSVYLIHGLVIVVLRQLLPVNHAHGPAVWLLLVGVYIVAITCSGALLRRFVEEPCRILLRGSWWRRGATRAASANA